MKKATNMLVAVCLGALGVGVLARAAAPEPQESPAAPKPVPVTKELWEDQGIHKIQFAKIVPPVEGVSEKALAGVELLSAAEKPRWGRPLFDRSQRALLEWQKTLIDRELEAMKTKFKVGENPPRPAEEMRPTFEQEFEKTFHESDLVEKTESELPSGKKVPIYKLKEGREKDKAKLMFQVARAHLPKAKSPMDRETTIMAEARAAAGIVCDPPYQHHMTQAWAYVVDAYLQDKDGDFVEGLNHFLASRGVEDWRVQSLANPTWESLTAEIDKGAMVVLSLQQPLEGRTYVTVVGFVAADRSLIVSLPSNEALRHAMYETAPWGTKHVPWADVSGRAATLFRVVSFGGEKENTKGEEGR